MTHVIDKIMIKAGFEADHVKNVRFRTALYAGNLIMVALTIIFLSLILK